MAHIVPKKCVKILWELSQPILLAPAMNSTEFGLRNRVFWENIAGLICSMQPEVSGRSMQLGKHTRPHLCIARISLFASLSFAQN